MGVIFDARPNVRRWRDEETGRYTKEPEEEFITWCAEVTYRLADRTQAGTAYNILIICLTVEADVFPSEEDFLVGAQAEIGSNYIPYGVKGIESME